MLPDLNIMILLKRPPRKELTQNCYTDDRVMLELEGFMCI